jgi:hypothetical protein
MTGEQIASILSNLGMAVRVRTPMGDKYPLPEEWDAVAKEINDLALNDLKILKQELRHIEHMAKSAEIWSKNIGNVIHGTEVERILKDKVQSRAY